MLQLTRCPVDRTMRRGTPAAEPSMLKVKLCQSVSHWQVTGE